MPPDGDGWLQQELFGPGFRILTSAQSRHGITAVVLSDTGEFWAECGVHTDPGGELEGYIDQFRLTTVREQGSGGYSVLPSKFETILRFSAEVSQVEIEFPGGPTLTAPAVDGFVVFNSADPYFDGGPDRESTYPGRMTFRGPRGHEALPRGRPGHTCFAWSRGRYHSQPRRRSRQEIIRRAVLERYERSGHLTRVEDSTGRMLDKWGDVLDRLGTV